MKNERIKLTSPLQKAFQIYYSFKKIEPWLPKRRLISYKKGEAASVPQADVDGLVKRLTTELHEEEIETQLGCSISDLYQPRKEPGRATLYYFKTERMKKFLTFVRSFLQENEITMLQLGEELRKQGICLDAITINNYLALPTKDKKDKRKGKGYKKGDIAAWFFDWIKEKLFKHCEKKEILGYEKEILDYCGIKNFEELIEISRTPVTDEIIQKINRYIKRYDFTMADYALIARVDRATIIRVLNKELKTTKATVIEPSHGLDARLKQFYNNTANAPIKNFSLIGNYLAF